MKICMFSNTYLPHVGGVAISVATFSRELRKKGHAVMVVAPKFDGKAPPEDEQYVCRVAAIQNFNGSDFSVRVPVPGLVDNDIDAFAPDIIHSHHPFLLGDTALRTAQRLNVPIIFTHHTRYEEYTHYVPLDSEVLKRFVTHLATEYANLCDTVIAPSTSIKKLLLERGVTTAVEVLPTGIDLDSFQQGNGLRFREANGLDRKCPVIGHVGRLAREKNLPYLAEAVARCMQKRTDAVFVVAGGGDAEQDIRRIFARADLEKRLIMPGILVGDDLADCYNAMDIFVFGSKSETQGLVLMEAMAAGTPVIALHASGVNDVVEDGKNGRVLPADCSVDVFAEVIADVLTKNSMEQWREQARHTARSFSREKCTEQLLQLYTHTLEQQRAMAVEADTLDELVQRIRVEWDLLQEKASALAQSISR